MLRLLLAACLLVALSSAEKSPGEELLAAVKLGDASAVSALIKQGAPLDHQEKVADRHLHTSSCT